MSRALVAGLCPLPFENTTMSFGPGIRSWQFAASLAADGHRVRLIAMTIPGCYDGQRAVSEETVDGVEILRVVPERFGDRARMEEAVADFAPQVLVGATVYGSNALARVGGDLPFWADQFGHVMAEAQAKAAVDRDNRVLPYFWRMVKRIDRRADRFSVVSEPQRYALIGELGALGRLSAETCGYEFVSVVPCAALPTPEEGERSPLRGDLVPDDAFVVLWSGSYNVWSDVETLFAGLETAMRAEPRIRFVSTGGAIVGHDEVTYRRLLELVEASSMRQNFLFKGWLPAEEIPSYQRLADIGVLTERPIYEGALGSKNRVVQWLAAGLPVAYNRHGDLGELLDVERLGLSFPPGDAEGLAARIVWASRHPEELSEIASRARAHAREHLSFASTTRALRSWAAEPTRAPDRAAMGAGIETPDGHGSLLREVVSKASRPRIWPDLWRRLRSSASHWR